MTIRKAYDLPSFLGTTVPVDFISQLLDYQVTGHSIILRCATDHYEPELHNYYGTVCETTFTAPTKGQVMAVQLDVCSDEIIRLRMARGDVPENLTPMVVGEFSGPRVIDVSEDTQMVKVKTAAVELSILRNPWQLKLCDHMGKLIWASKPIDIAPLMRPTEQWNPPEQRWIFMHRYAYPMGLTATTEQAKSFGSFYLHHDEQIYGFGESYGKLDKHGTEQRLWLQEVFSNAAPAAYKQAPFYMSSRGYGLFVNSSNAIACKVGSLEHTTLSITIEDSDFFDAYLIYGPTFKDILPRYTSITGAPALPPKWSFGLWMGRISYNSQEQVENVAQTLRERHIPCDVIHIDTDWYEYDWACDLKFGPSKFPDPAAMMATLKALGFRVSLWQWPNMLVGTPMFNEGHPEGYFAKTSNDKTYTYSGFMEDGAFLDYSNPATVDWVKDKFRDLFKLGVSAIKTDFGEGSPPDAHYHSVASESMHNRYPLLYNKAVFEVTQEFWGEDEAVVWSRSAWAGSQRYPVHWSGDGIARFEDLACVLRATLSFGLTGFPFYSHDIGGFSGIPSPELYVRWAQLGLFSSHARAHGTPPREPWDYGEEAETIFRRYTELRYQLMPYIYSEAVVCCQQSLPMVRALALEHPDDPTAIGVDDQYYFGRHLLIAPILDQSNQRKIYLPHGQWFDFWTKVLIEGGRWLEVEAPLDVMPMYVRAGAMLPFGSLVQHLGAQLLEPLRLELYLTHEDVEGQYDIYQDPRISVMVNYQLKENHFELACGKGLGRVTVQVVGRDVTSARYAGELLVLDENTVSLQWRAEEKLYADL